MKTITLLAAILLTGCAPGQPFIADHSPNGVAISRANMTGSAGMLQMADAHCARYGKHAEYAGGADTFVSQYRCVK